MLTPREVAVLILNYSTDDPERVADLVLDGLAYAGYAVVTRDEYVALASKAAAVEVNR